MKIAEHIQNLPFTPEVDPGGKWIFLRNGRTATTSMTQGVLRGVRRNKHKEQWDEAWRTVFSSGIDGAVLFTFVRNTWERICSGFFHCRDRVKGHVHKIDPRWEFCDYVKEVLRTKGPSVNMHFAPQYDSLCCEDKRIPNMFVGRFEHLKRDWGELARILGVKGRLPHWNAGRGDYFKYYDTETQAIIAEVYAKEIAILGYEFRE